MDHLDTRREMDGVAMLKGNLTIRSNRNGFCETSAVNMEKCI
jgi:hypothetical protein